ncbi:MAG: glutathione S-transferase family protein [Halobacteriovoraceae bacterium]|jgi:glutathione S-transferase|nr:glutathione S-transferase family protein [Halobacteriovoraceae bacterium]MBT5094089.1 glutathione S-transferase family protein [Halobacteriovoraceae bacterium]
MIELHQYPVSKSSLVPNNSPFCAKLECYLKAAKVEYISVPFHGNPAKAPKGKLPYIVDQGQSIADSELVIKYLKQRHQVDLDQGLSKTDQAIACAFKKLIEDHLAWALVQCRWVDQDNWQVTCPSFFGHLPPVINKIVPAIVRKGVAKSTWAQGMGRHAKTDLLSFADEDFNSLSDFLADKTYFFGEDFTSLDASAYGLLCNILNTPFTPDLKELLQKYPNLVKYIERITELYFKK